MPSWANRRAPPRADCPHYRWLGALPHAQTRQRIQRAHVLVHTSALEGGAHVIMEAVRSGTPVLASRVPGNIGMLGADYAGYFPHGDAAALAGLLEECRAGQAAKDPSAGLLARLGHTMRLARPAVRCDCRARRADPTPARTRPTTMNAAVPQAATEPRLTSLSHGGGCGCKIAPGVLSEILKGTARLPMPPELLVGIETADDAAVYRLNDEQALIATTDFFMPIVDDPFDFGRIAATNAISDVYAMGGRPIMALALVGMPINVLSTATIARILEGGESVCRAAGIPIAGGHTIDSVEPIYGLVALGLVHPKRVKRNADARVGDVLVLGKPLGVGVLSAALKKEKLDAAGYERMIATTTRLNTPGPELAALEGVHALTDVTGFGLAGHSLELARGANLSLEIAWQQVPVLEGVRDLVRAGHVTGASGRNWAGYGAEVALPDNFAAQELALLTDPQTSGGLLVSCAPEAVNEVLAVFQRHGFNDAAVVGSVKPRGRRAAPGRPLKSASGRTFAQPAPPDPIWNIQRGRRCWASRCRASRAPAPPSGAVLPRVTNRRRPPRRVAARLDRPWRRGLQSDR